MKETYPELLSISGVSTSGQMPLWESPCPGRCPVTQCSQACWPARNKINGPLHFSLQGIEANDMLLLQNKYAAVDDEW